MFDKERSERDVHDRIRWDGSLKPEELTVCYLDRFSLGLKEVRYLDLALDGDYMRVGDSAVPLHRIREVRRQGRVVWAKRRS